MTESCNCLIIKKLLMWYGWRGQKVGSPRSLTYGHGAIQNTWGQPRKMCGKRTSYTSRFSEKTKNETWEDWFYTTRKRKDFYARNGEINVQKNWMGLHRPHFPWVTTPTRKGGEKGKKGKSERAEWEMGQGKEELGHMERQFTRAISNLHPCLISRFSVLIWLADRAR